jgi:hypothetical protein
MRRTIIQCEACEKQYSIPGSMGEGEWARLDNGWLTVHQAGREDGHYCSEVCLIKSLGAMPAYIALVQAQQHKPTDAPQSKMRRFLLVDGETADEFEAIKFSSGHVSVDFDGKHFPMHFSSWDNLKEMNTGSGITWIDQEVSDAN